MLVDASGRLSGSIGGGALEWAAIDAAQQFGGQAFERDYPLGPALGQCCGGQVRLRFEAASDQSAGSPPPLRPVALFGCGHVGQALLATLAALPVAVTAFDPRPEYPGATHCQWDTLDPGSAIVIMTHSHALDLELCAAALRRPFPFIGLIGSATKAARFASRLRALGLDPARLTCPIGIAAVSGKQPAVIALSVAAQLLSLPQSRAK